MADDKAADAKAEKPRRHNKVLKVQILKPAGDLTWKELGSMLREARYRTFRLANLIVSENYLAFHLFRTGRTEEFQTRTPGALNRELRAMLATEGRDAAELDRFSKTGALPDAIVGALSQYKTRAVTSKSKWKEVLSGKASLPTFRANMAIPVRCDNAPGFIGKQSPRRRLDQCENGDVELDLVLCCKPYPRVVLATRKLNEGPRAILARLLANESQSLDGYRQRCFEIKEDERSRTWWLFISYDFPASDVAMRRDVVVGVDLGFTCPVYVAVSNGHARLGWRQFAGVAARVKSLQNQTMARRRQMLTAGRSSLTDSTARSGHGRARRLAPISILEGRIGDAYRTLNHQLSTSIVDFARQQGAGVIQLEDLEGLKEKLTGTFLGQRWRYHELQQFIEYKAAEANIEVRRVPAVFTSRRCSKCGHIHVAFDSKFRSEGKAAGKRVRFECPQCEYSADPDYNAARNLATIGVAELIKKQCKTQGIEYPKHE